MDITLWTGLLSFATQYSGLIVVTIFVVDYFSYRSKKALLIGALYFIIILVTDLAISSFLLDLYNNGALHHITFEHCYNNILLALSAHVFFGSLIFILYLKNIALGARSLAVNVWDHVNNKRQKVSSR